MLTKEKLLATLNAMPEDEFNDLDFILERIVTLEKVERSERDIKDGKVYSTEEARQNLERWLK